MLLVSKYGSYGCMHICVPYFCVRKEDFMPKEIEAEEILQSSCKHVDKIICIPPCKPKAGEAYLFKLDSTHCISSYVPNSNSCRHLSQFLNQACAWLFLKIVFVREGKSVRVCVCVCVCVRACMHACVCVCVCPPLITRP